MYWTVLSKLKRNSVINLYTQSLFDTFFGPYGYFLLWEIYFLLCPAVICGYGGNSEEKLRLLKLTAAKCQNGPSSTFFYRKNWRNKKMYEHFSDLFKNYKFDWKLGDFSWRKQLLLKWKLWKSFDAQSNSPNTSSKSFQLELINNFDIQYLNSKIMLVWQYQLITTFRFFLIR